MTDAARAAIIEALEDALDIGGPFLKAADQAGRKRWESAFPYHCANPVSAALQAHPTIAAIDGKILRHTGGATPIDLSQTARLFVERAYDASPEAVIDSLLDLCDGAVVPLLIIRGVAGFECETPLSFSEDTRLVPPSSLPSTKFRHWIFDPHDPARPANEEKPASAFIYTAETRLELLDGFPKGPPPAAFGQLMNAAHRAFHQAGEVLALTGRHAPRLLAMTEFVDAPGWPILTGAGVRRTWANPVLPTAVLDAADQAAITEASQRLAAGLPDSARVAFQKLKDARSRLYPLDRALDLGVCLEVLLTHGEGQAAEINHRLRIRAAWLLGADAADRAAIHHLVGVAYQLRSDIAHTGRIRPKSTGNQPLSTTLDQIEALCDRLLRHVIEHGWPDWTTLVLGAGADADPPENAPKAKPKS